MYDSVSLMYWDLTDEKHPQTLDSKLFQNGLIPPPGYPESGGLLRFEDFDWNLRTRKVDRRNPAKPFTQTPSSESNDPNDQGLVLSRSGITWAPDARRGTTAFVNVSSRSATIRTLVIAGVPSFWKPSESERGPVLLAPSRRADSIFIWSGYSTVREIDAKSGRVLRCVSATMPQTGLVCFGADRHLVFAARPLDVTVLWHRKGTPTKVNIQGEEVLRPPIDELGTSNGKGDRGIFSTGTRALTFGQGLLIRGTDQGRIQVRLLKDRNGGPWKTLGSQGEAIRALALAPDQPLLLSGARDGSLCLWNLAETKQLVPLPFHEARVNAAAFAQGGVAATAGPDGIRLWRFPEGRELRHIKTSGVWVSDITLDPKGQWVAAALLDGSIRCWEIGNGSILWKTATAHGWCSSIAFDPRSNKIAAGFESGSLAILSAKNGSIVRETQVSVKTAWQNGPGPVHAVAWSTDGLALAAACGDAVQIYSPALQTGEGNPWCLPLNWSDYYT